MLASRHLLVVFYLGLAVALAAYALHFGWKLWKFAAGAFTASDTDMLLGLLYLLDSALVGGLVVTVAIASYDSLVAKLGQDAAPGHWVPAADPGNLKVKLASAIIAISSIHLLQVFMQIADYSDRTIGWSVGIHALFLLGGLCLVAMDRLEGKAAK
jgi:uncharacterized protein (TIGR00645 family)